MAVVTPKPISGFPELLPEQQIVFNRCINVIRGTFELFGFTPIETPSVERREVLTSKGGNEKEIYALARLLAEPGETTDLAMHFDLTVPLARYVAQHKEQLVFPFRRYQIQKVWRGERSQAGRYRELYQCDIDVIGRGSVGLFADAEIPSIIYRIFSELNIGGFVIRINNRRLLQGFFESVGVAGDDIAEVLRSVDRIEKIGRDALLTDLTGRLALSAQSADAILAFIAIDRPTDEVLGMLADSPFQANPRFAQGAAELTGVIEGIRSLGVPDSAFKVDLSIARGLDYYTGTVYETQLLAHPELGSICSGGRYDDLASFFTNEKLPGVGISIGLSRLVIKLLEVGLLKAGPMTPARALVTTLDPARMSAYLSLAADLRNAGVATELYTEKGKLGEQLKYAAKKGFRFALIAGETEFAADQVKLKDLVNTTEVLVARSKAAGIVREALNS